MARGRMAGVELQEAKASAPPAVPAAIASNGDVPDDDAPPEAARSYFAEKSIFKKRPAVRNFDAVWQVRQKNEDCCYSTQQTPDPATDSLFPCCLNLSLGEQDKPLRMLKYRAGWLHTIGWIPGFPHLRNIRGTVLTDHWLWIQARPPALPHVSPSLVFRRMPTAWQVSLSACHSCSREMPLHSCLSARGSCFGLQRVAEAL